MAHGTIGASRMVCAPGFGGVGVWPAGGTSPGPDVVGAAGWVCAGRTSSIGPPAGWVAAWRMARALRYTSSSVTARSDRTPTLARSSPPRRRTTSRALSRVVVPAGSTTRASPSMYRVTWRTVSGPWGCSVIHRTASRPLKMRRPTVRRKSPSTTVTGWPSAVKVCISRPARRESSTR